MQEFDYLEDTNIRANFDGTKDLNIHSAAQMVALSHNLGIPKNAVRSNIPLAQQEIKSRDIEQDYNLNRWAGFEPENAAVVRDDAYNMLDVNKNIDSMDTSPVEELGFFDMFGAQYDLGKQQIELSETARRFIDAQDPIEQEKIRQEIFALQSSMNANQQRIGTDILDSFHPSNVAKWLPQLADSLQYMPENLAVAAPYGASIGAATGSVVGGVGAVPGAIAGLATSPAAAFAMSNFESSSNIERNLFIAEMAQEKDLNGNYIPVEELNTYATLYGIVSAAVESVGIGTAAKALGITDMIKGIGEDAAKRQIKGYIQKAMKDKTLYPALIEFGKKALVGGTVEGTEETLQQFASNITESLLKNSVADSEQTAFEEVNLTEGLIESFAGGAGMGLWLGGGGGFARGVYDYNQVKKQQKFTELQNQIHAEVEKLAVKNESSEITEDYLKFRHSQLNQDVQIPSKALLELAQSDVNLLGDLDIDLIKLEEFSSAGLDYPVNLAKIHAHLDNDRFATVSSIMKTDVEAFNSFDSAMFDEDMNLDSTRIQNMMEEYYEYENELEFQLDAFSQGLRGQIEYLPDLKIQAEAFGGVDKYIEAQTELYKRIGIRLAERTGTNPSQYLANVSFGDEAKVNAEQLQEETTLYQAQEPFYGNIYGRIERDSLADSYPQLARELEYMYGRGIFSRKGKGLAFDEIADELTISNQLNVVDMNPTDALAEKLKEGNNFYTKENRSKLKRQRDLEKKNRGSVQSSLFQKESIEPKNPLLVTHGIYADNIIQADKLGGLPVPSIGISKADEVLTNFGDVILIGDTNLIANEPVFSNDVYTTRFPDVKYSSVDKSKSKDLLNNLNKNNAELDGYSQIEEIEYYLYSEVNKDKFYQSLDYDIRNMIDFLKENKVNYTLSYKKNELSGFSANKDFINYVKNLGSEKISEGSQEHKDISQIYKDVLKKKTGQSENRFIDSNGLLKFVLIESYIYNVQQYEKNNSTNKEVDFYETRKDLQSLIKEKGLSESYKKRNKDIVDELFLDPKISIGNKKVDFNLDNVVKAMSDKKIVGKEKTLTFSNGQLIASRAKKFKNIEDIKKNRDKIQVENENFNQYKQNIETLLDDFRKSLYDFAKFQDSFTLFDDALRALSKVGKKPTKEQLKNSLSKFDFVDVSDDVLEIGLKAISEIDKGLVAYFEAKPQRAVSLNEFSGAVIPENSSQGLKDVLIRNGIEFTTYDGTNDNLSSVVSEFSRELNKKNNNILFQKTIETVRGNVKKLEDDTYIINLFQDANLSTITHELAHIAFLEMQSVDMLGLGDESLSKDMNTLKEWLGMEEGEIFTVEGMKGATLEEKQNRYVNIQEQLARGFEQYLRDGKAPVPNLRNVFARFSRWLKSIYKHALSLNVMINDDVKDVFDRMIASESEIQAASGKYDIAQFTENELSGLGLSETVKNIFKTFTSSIQQEAEDKLVTARNRARSELKKNIINQEKESAEKMQVYKAIESFKDSGINKDDVVAIMGDDVAKKLGQRYKGKIKKEGGKSPQELAVENGYNSTEEFLSDILRTETMNQYVNRRVEERLSGEDHNYIAEDVLFETKALATQEYQLAIAYSKKQGIEENAVLKDSEIRATARNILLNMSLREAGNSNKFISSARSIYRKERNALNKGDYAQALEFNTQARIQLSMAQQSKKLNEDIAKTQRAIDRFLKNAKDGTNKKNPIARYWVNKLGYTFGMQKQNVRLWQDKSNDDIYSWAAENEVYVDNNLLSAPMMDYRDMSYNMYSLLQEQFETIIYMERESRMIDTANGKVETSQLTSDMSNSIRSNVKTKIGKQFQAENKAISGITKFFTSLLKVDTITRLLDGDKLGIVWENIYNRINLATFDFNNRIKEFKTNLNKLFSVYSAKELKQIRTKKFVVEVFADEAITKEIAISIALNSGNEGNLTRLKNGYPYYGKDEGGKLSDAQIQAVLNTLSKKDWDFVQSVWDYFETFQKESFDLEEQMTGVRPVKVEATPIQTQYGTYKGGYFPIVYDSSKSGKAPKGFTPEENKNAFNVPSVPHGSMKERQGEGLRQVPLRLSLDTIPENISKTIHNLSFRKPVKEVSKLLRNDTLRTAIESTAGVPQYKALLDWLVDVAGGSQNNFTGADHYANWTRSSQSVMSMGYKVSTMLTQLAGSIHAMPEIGVMNVMNGIAHTIWNLPRLNKLIEEVNAKSKIMKYRVENVERDVADYNRKILYGGNKVIQGIKENAFTPMGYIQLVTADLPVWWGAYQKGLKDFDGDDKKAIQYADNAVEITQGSGSMKDLAAVQRGSEVQKLFTMYYTFFSAVYQMQYRRTTMLARKKDLASAWNLANYILVGMVLSNIVSEFLAGRGPDEEEDEGIAEWIMKINLTYPVQGIPILRDLTNGLLGDYGYSLSPAESAPASVVRGLKKLYDAGFEGFSEFDKDDAVSVAKGIGYATQNPMFGNQATGMVRELWDYLDGTDPEFEAWRIIMGKKN